MASNRRIGEILCDLGFLTWDQLEEALELQKGKPTVFIGEQLREMGYLTASQLELGLRKQAEEQHRL